MRYGADGLQRMFLGGTDVTEKIRLPEISMYASAVSAIPAVRAFLLEMRRDMARRSSVTWMAGTSALWCCQIQVKIFLCAGCTGSGKTADSGAGAARNAQAL